MRNFLILVALVFVGILAWRLSDTISRDAVIMGIGFLFGALAGVPAALLVVASQRRREEPPPMPYYQHQPHPQQPPGYRPRRRPPATQRHCGDGGRHLPHDDPTGTVYRAGMKGRNTRTPAHGGEKLP